VVPWCQGSKVAAGRTHPLHPLVSLIRADFLADTADQKITLNHLDRFVDVNFMPPLAKQDSPSSALND